MHFTIFKHLTVEELFSWRFSFLVRQRKQQKYINPISLVYNFSFFLFFQKVKVWFQNRRTKHKRLKQEESGEESGKSPISDKGDRCFSDDEELEEDESEIDPDGFASDEAMDVSHMLLSSRFQSNGHQLPFTPNAAVMAHALAMQAAAANSNNMGNTMSNITTTGSPTADGNHKQTTMNIPTSNGPTRSSPNQGSLSTSTPNTTLPNTSSSSNSAIPISSQSPSGTDSIPLPVSSGSSPTSTPVFPQHLFSQFGYLNSSLNTNADRTSLNSTAGAETFLYSRFNRSPLASQTNQNSATGGLTAQQS